MTYYGQTEWGVTIVDDQSEWTPLQRNFLALAASEYGPDPDEYDDPDVPSTPRTPSRSPSASRFR